jgi:ribulose-5-phosphate 4-epimerase/fuculose-1-phosphate aldolase
VVVAGTKFGPRLELPPLTDVERFALLHRMLWREGFDDRIAGHMTLRAADDTVFAIPFGLRWDEIRASDIVRIDRDGNVVEGARRVSSNIALHLAVHRHRRDAVVTVHHHPRWATVWAAAHKIPPLYDQLSAFAPDDLVLYPDYEAGVNNPDIAEANVRALGSSCTALLANHGVLVLAQSVEDAHLRCVALEHRARLAWHVTQLGGGEPLRPDVAAALADTIRVHNGWSHFFAAAARDELRRDADVLQ